MKRELYVVPVKNKRKGRVTDIKVFEDYSKANEFSMDKRDTHSLKYIEKPVMGVYAEDKDDAIRQAKKMFPEHMEDSDNVMKILQRYAKEPGI